MKKKIFELSDAPDMVRREFWKQNIPALADYEFVDFPGAESGTSSEETFKTQWKNILKEACSVLVDEKYSSLLLKFLPQVSQRLLEVQCIDSIFQDEKKNIWPHCLAREALHELITQTAPHLDTSAAAYVTGSGPMMRVALAVAVQLGYRSVYVVMKSSEIVPTLESELKRLYFDTKISVMRNADLTLQKNNGSLLINTLEFAGHEELSEDISYLNFIFAGGLVVDTCRRQIKNSLLDEALHVGLQTIHGGAFQAGVDWYFIKNLLGTTPWSQGEYRTKWLEFVKSQKNPPKVQ